MVYNINILKSFLRKIIPQAAINLGFHLPKAFFASLYYRFPARKLKIIGVTGTDGKTTTVNLIYHILNFAGKKAGVVSTVSTKIGQEEIDIGFHVTAPDPRLLQKLLREMVDEKIEYAVLEATSHGLDQNRLFGLNFEIGVITNITREHLDYHKTYENYLKAKAKLLYASKLTVLNKDDQSYNNLKLKIKNLKLITYGIKNKADFTPEAFPFKTLLPGEYNQYNCLAAIAVASQLGISQKTIQEAVASFEGVTGRMEPVNEGQDFKVIIDFAHTPNALEEVLKTLRSQKPARQASPACKRLALSGRPGEAGGSKVPLRPRSEASKSQKSRLIVVFGAAGLRDQGKRPIMGEIACRLADLVVLTAEDPRTEDVNDIINQIAGGCEGVGARLAEVGESRRGIEGKTYFKIPDRQEAINLAIQKLAKKGDTVIICGKGHEKSMCFGEVEYPWLDQEAVKKSLRERRPA